jgi:hypothetical protein
VRIQVPVATGTGRPKRTLAGDSLPQQCLTCMSEELLALRGTAESRKVGHSRSARELVAGPSSAAPPGRQRRAMGAARRQEQQDPQPKTSRESPEAAANSKKREGSRQSHRPQAIRSRVRSLGSQSATRRSHSGRFVLSLVTCGADTPSGSADTSPPAQGRRGHTTDADGSGRRLALRRGLEDCAGASLITFHCGMVEGVWRVGAQTAGRPTRSGRLLADPHVSTGSNVIPSPQQ